MRLKGFLLVSCLALAVAGKHGASEGAPPVSNSNSGSGSPGPPSTTSTSSSSTTSVSVAQTTSSSSPAPPPAPLPPPPSTQASSNPAPSQPSTSSSPPLPTGQPSSSIPIKFNLVQNITTCESATFSWLSLSNTPMTLTIAVTNDRSTQNNIVIRQAQTTLVTQVVSANTSSMSGSIVWPAVDVPAGVYAVLAFETGNENAGMVKSNLFNVTSGNSTACLSAASSSVSLPVASSTTSTATSATSGSATGSSTSNSGGSSKSLSTGALIGVVVGVILGVLGLIVALTLIPRMYRKGMFRVRRPRRPGAPYYLF